MRRQNRNSKINFFLISGLVYVVHYIFSNVLNFRIMFFVYYAINIKYLVLVINRLFYFLIKIID